MNDPNSKNTLGVFTGDRPDLLRFVDTKRKSALDVGCGEGAFATLLRSCGLDNIVGIEPDPVRAAIAAENADRVICSTVEDALDGELGGEQFDLIVASDVIEHLVDPWTVVKRLADHLAPDGQLLLSVPNVGNLQVVKQLVLHGDWRYEDEGLFDRTHLRWFGRHTVRSLLEGAGLVPERWGARLSIGVGPLRMTRIVDNAARIPSLAIFQHLVLARRP
ncbi:MAG: class I SAM-dependent methyltransferase [Actinomycetes bacterium]